MGSTIHLHIEVKINGNWEHYSAPNIKRWYRLFALMAGVRNESFGYTPIATHKGLPADLTLITKMCYAEEGSAAHHENWFNHTEIKMLAKTLQQWQREDCIPAFPGYDLETVVLNTYFFENSFAGALPNGIEDLRFVFWFDN